MIVMTELAAGNDGDVCFIKKPGGHIGRCRENLSTILAAQAGPAISGKNIKSALGGHAGDLWNRIEPVHHNISPLFKFFDHGLHNRLITVEGFDSSLLSNRRRV